MLTESTVALVTGASSGIGAATVRRLREAGIQVHAAARRAERLDDLASETGCIAHVLDVRDRAAVAQLGAEVAADILVNNAGLGRAIGGLAEADAEDIDLTVDTNVTAALHMVRAVLPGMIERGRGHIVNMGSVAGLYPARSALYGATKGAMHVLSLNLRQELQGTGIRVTEICPGRVTTEFYDMAIDDVSARAEMQESGIEELTSDDVASTVLYALSLPWRVNINRIELQPTEQTYGGAQFVPFERREADPAGRGE